MLERFRDFLRTSGGQYTAAGLGIVGLLAAVMSARSNFGDTEATAISRERLYICSETGKSFKLEVEPGMMTPVQSPHSGKRTGYEADFCYWTKDGKVKQEGTPVLVNQTAGKKGPTFCPDCDRLVYPRNPPAVPGMPPPPTKAEYKPAPLER